MTEFTLLAEVGDPTFGTDLADALSRVGNVHAVSVPGHDGAPAGSLQSAELALGMLAEAPTAGVLVGVGTSGWCAQVFALAGRVERLVLVDGFGGPWCSAGDQMRDSIERRRRLLADPDAMGDPPQDGLDPRARHGLWTQRNQRLVEEAVAALSVPVLAIDTGVGPLTEAEMVEISSLLAHGTRVRLTPRSAETVAAAIGAWADGVMP